MLEARNERARLQQQQKLLEQLVLWDDWETDYYRDLYLRARSRDGDPYFVPGSRPGDRRHGQDSPFVWTEHDLDQLRQKSRLLCRMNAFAQGLLRNLTNYVIGVGFNYKISTKEKLADADPDKAGVQTDKDPDEPGVQTDDNLDKLVAQAQDFVDEFLQTNRWNCTPGPQVHQSLAATRERECYRRLFRDGECFIRFYRMDDGRTIVRFVEPEQVRNPTAAQPDDGWSHGIRHRMDPFEDVETYEAYWVVWQDPTTHEGEGEGEEVAASDVLHLKGPDTDAAIKRGLPTLSYDPAAAVDRAAKLQRNLSIAAQLRAATAEIWKHTQATQTQVSALAAGLREVQLTNPLTGQNENIERIKPGAIRRVPDGQEPVTLPNDQTGSYLQGVQGDLQQAASAYAAPAYWLGDTANANYSNLETASAPPVKNGQTEQEYYKTAFACVIWCAIRWAVERGRLPKAVLSVCTLQVEAPKVLHRNELEIAQEDQILVTMEIKSRQTVMMERGLDPEQEQANIDEWNERHGQQQGGGLPMPGQDDGGMGSEAPPPPGAGDLPGPFDAPEALAEGGFFADCPRDEKGHCEPKGSADAAKAGDDSKADKTGNSDKPSSGSHLPKVTDIRKSLKKADVPTHIAAHAKEVEAKIGDGERQAVHRYTEEDSKGATGYVQLNKAARACPDDLKCLSDEQKKAFQALNDVASRHEFAEPVVAYRGVALKGETREQFLAMAAKAAETGEPMQFHGITSLSLDPEIAGGHARGDIVMEIETSRGVYVDPLSQIGGEHEILHAHGTKYRVVGIQKRRRYEGVGDNVTAIQMTEVR